MLNIVLKKVNSSTAETLVNAPVDRVFSYVADFTRYPEWSGETIRSHKKTSQGPVGVGTTFRMVLYYEGQAPSESSAGTSPRTEIEDVEVTEFVCNERIAWEHHGGQIAHRIIIGVQPVASGTRMVLRDEWLGYSDVLDYIMSWVLFMAWPFAWLATWHATRSKIRSIKTRVESGL